MEKSLKISNRQETTWELFNTALISEATKNKLHTTDFVALPQKYCEEYYFAKETIDFIKFCRQNNSDYTFDILADGDVKIRSLHSFDIWLPVLWISSQILLPIAVNLVSNFISDKLKGREKEDAKVDVTLIVKRDNEEKILHYNGDAKTFEKTFEKIDLNKM